jgi:hypothetical protein
MLGEAIQKAARHVPELVSTSIHKSSTDCASSTTRSGEATRISESIANPSCRRTETYTNSCTGDTDARHASRLHKTYTIAVSGCAHQRLGRPRSVASPSSGDGRHAISSARTRWPEINEVRLRQPDIARTEAMRARQGDSNDR